MQCGQPYRALSSTTPLTLPARVASHAPPSPPFQFPELAKSILQRSIAAVKLHLQQISGRSTAPARSRRRRQDPRAKKTALASGDIRAITELIKMSEGKSQRLARQLGIYDDWEKVHEEMMIQCAALKKAVRHMVRKMAGDRTPASARAGDERGEGPMAMRRRSERFRGVYSARDGASSGRPRGNRVRGGGGGVTRKPRPRDPLPQLPQIRGSVGEARARRAAAGPRGATPPKRQRVGGRGGGDRGGRGSGSNGMEIERGGAPGRQRSRSDALSGSSSSGNGRRGGNAMEVDYSGARPRSRSEAGGASPSKGLLRSASGGAGAYQSRMQSFKSKLRCVARARGPRGHVVFTESTFVPVE